jgi:hypothetical protein
VGTSVLAAVELAVRDSELVLEPFVCVCIDLAARLSTSTAYPFVLYALVCHLDRVYLPVLLCDGGRGCRRREFVELRVSGRYRRRAVVAHVELIIRGEIARGAKTCCLCHQCCVSA